MDWKILVIVLIALVGFYLTRQCTEEDEPNYDQVRQQEQAERQMVLAKKKAAENCASEPAFVPLGNGEDSDGDGMADWWELQYFGNLDRDGTGDWDGDGLIDLAEFEHDTDPTNPDSDGDGFTDGDEVGAGTDPNDPQSHPSRAMPWIPLLLLDD